jgi:glutamine synthetase
VFIGFGGHALDKKTPLLRSVEALSKQALRILKLFGKEQVARVITWVGPEQEYFLIDRKYYLLRPDLVAAGRTLYGARPPKGQEMEDHYFGAIKERVLAYMVDLERELYRLGIPVTTRHNEVAPSQFEIAPLHERANIATDHNMLTMSVMKTVAHKHGFECLLHEKPFAGVNGSGKHNNWSIGDDQGNNLLEPGHTPHENAQFLVFLSAVLKAVHLHGDLLRASIATPANDHRLGANEAPPAIISVYLGDKLTEVVEAIIQGSTARAKPQGYLNIGVATLPPLPLHDSDRNRTSPFAFTGNKFEFRAVGSSQSVARPNMVLNTIVADALSQMADEIEGELAAKKDLNEAVRTVVQKTLKEHQAILFNGDNYTTAWHQEAEKRGLPNLKNFVEAIPSFVTEKARKIFSGHGVLSEAELESRYHIGLEGFVKTICIEAAMTSNMGRTMILPAALDYQSKVATSIAATQIVLKNTKQAEQEKLLAEINEAVNTFIQMLNELDAVRAKAEESNHDLLAHATLYQKQVRPLMDKTRAAGDALELMVDDAQWPLPKYREMLFVS